MTKPLSLETAGTGVPLVFLHAFPLSMRMWDAEKARFSRNFRFVAVDLPGFGASPNVGETHDMELMARSVLSSLDQNGIGEPAVFAGLSMGGYVLLQILRLAPERVRAAVFAATRATADTAASRENRMRAIDVVTREGAASLATPMAEKMLGATTRSENPDLVARVRNSIAAADPEGICAAQRGMAARPDMSPILTTISAPSLVLSGEEDGLVSSAEMKEMAEKIRGSQFFSIPQCGHLINLEQPPAFQDHFLHFLKRKVL